MAETVLIVWTFVAAAVAILFGIWAAVMPSGSIWVGIWSMLLGMGLGGGIIYHVNNRHPRSRQAMRRVRAVPRDPASGRQIRPKGRTKAVTHTEKAKTHETGTSGHESRRKLDGGPEDEVRRSLRQQTSTGRARG